MARREIKSEGKDIAEAIIRGLNELGRRRDQVEVKVLQEPTSGFLGIGGKRAMVHIVEKKWDSEHSSPRGGRMRDKSPYMDDKDAGGRKPHGERGARKSGKSSRGPKAERAPKAAEGPKAPKENEAQKLPVQHIQNAQIPDEMKEPMAQAKESLEKILGYMNIKVENLNVWWDGKQQRILLTFDCDHPAVVIGKEGKTLESIQYLITLMVSRDFENPISVIADTQNYWRKLEDKIDEEISDAMRMLKRTKRPYKFRPMPAQIRRYVHRFFGEDSGITTASEGEGRFRKVVLRMGAKGSSAAAEARPEREEKVDNNIARSKADLTPIDWDALNSADSDDKSGVVSQGNAGENCVLTAETTTCEDVADTNAVNTDK